jgi:hypothetical protein
MELRCCTTPQLQLLAIQRITRQRLPTVGWHQLRGPANCTNYLLEVNARENPTVSDSEEVFLDF